LNYFLYKYPLKLNQDLEICIIQHSSVKKDSTFLEDLTEKELKILTLYCEGAEREEIAEILQISSGTLKNHISSILKKTDFPNMPKLSIYCVANDYIVPNLKE